jgi:importin subunit beta-1
MSDHLCRHCVEESAGTACTTPLPPLQVILPEIRKTFELPAASSEAREKQAEVQGQLCGVLLVVVKKLSEEADTKAAVLPYADAVSSRALIVTLHISQQTRACHAMAATIV